MRPFDERDRAAVTALRVLSIDQVEQADSGHPGLPLGCAPMAYALWSRFLRFDPAAPDWFDRDRFVLSAGHGSALLYALLHLFGYALPLDELRRFRQWGSLTPGHPEHGLTPGVETTTGPLGQGFATAVGMAMAERHLAARFNRPGHEIVGHRTFVIASDGDLMEGISHEAASLAGHLRLGRLIVLFDDNRITIDGPTSLACSDDAALRFAGYGWRVLHCDDGNDLDAIAAALAQATSDDDAPTLIRIRTHIGFGSPAKQDTSEAHGAPLGRAEWEATRAALGWTVPEPFVVPDEIRATFTAAAAAAAASRTQWLARRERYTAAHPEAAAELDRRVRGELPDSWERLAPDFGATTGMATRQASGRMLNALAAALPELVGGSADLAPSNNTLLAGEGTVAPADFGGRNIHFGIREHAMAAACNGMALHGGIRPYAGTFLVFSDYMRPAVRLAALMKQPVVFVFTHDSVGLGEDGPTHQPVEHVVALRVIPNLVVLRPADAHETVAAWRIALQRRTGPTALVLTRQKVPVLAPPPPGAVERGAYVKAEGSGGAPEAVLIATGSEVPLALAAREELERRGVPTRVVSAPSLELLKEQNDAYRKAVLGPAAALRVAVEAGRGQGWHTWVGDGEAIVLSRFGASAPGDEVMRRLGFDADTLVRRVEQALASRRPAPVDEAVPAALAPAFEAAVERVESARLSERIAARDAATWGEEHAGSVAARLGWLDLPHRSPAVAGELARTVTELDAAGATSMVLLGMGGSSLAPQVLRATLGNPSGRELVVLDTTDPERVSAVLEAHAAASLAVVAVSKSGSTAETSSLLEIFWERLRAELGDTAGHRFVAVTEPGTPLARTARSRGFLATLPHPVDVGGRYSALSVVGLLPAAWLGHDVDRLLAAAAAGLARFDASHPAVRLAAATAAVARDGWARLALCGSPRLAALAPWVEQLVAESTGKAGRGVLPLVVEAEPRPWPATVYLSPRLAGEDTAALDATLDGIHAAGHPVIRWSLPPAAIGQAFTVLELATAVTAFLLSVNPFDEPDVVRAKQLARAALDAPAGGEPAMSERPGEALLAHLGRPEPLAAVTLLAYLPESPAVEVRLRGLAAALADRVGTPVTWAFGPRYLHSTGQLHKGGPDRMSFVLLTGRPARDVAIPGQRFTLGQLRLAQATGDLAALRDAGRTPLHLHLGGDPLAALADLLRTVAPGA